MSTLQYLRQLEPASFGRPLGGLLLVVFICLLVSPAMGLIMVGKGNDPVTDSNWPAGSLDMANLKTRVGWWEGPPFGGGQYCFLFRGDAAAFQQALDGFGKIKAPKLQLFVHDGGPAESQFLKDDKDPKSDGRYDWSFTVWDPESWHHLYNGPGSQFSAEDPNGGLHQAVDPPRLDVYAGDSGINFSKAQVPAGVSVIDERADANGFAGGSAVVGDVFDMVTSRPVAGAKIALAKQKAENEWEEAASGTTNADGHFELKGAPKGGFGVLASADGYAPRMLGYIELRGNTFKHFTAQLAPAATLTGTAVDTEGKPIAGVTVRADAVTSVDGRGYILPQRRQTVTDDKGKFELTGLPRGHAQLFAYADHYAGLDGLKLHPVPEEDVVIRLTATGNVKGRVLDKSGKPASNGVVDINPPGKMRIGQWGGSSSTGPDGTFHFENVTPGEYIVSAMATNPGPGIQGNDPNAKTITVKAGETSQVDVTGR